MGGPTGFQENKIKKNMKLGEYCTGTWWGATKETMGINVIFHCLSKMSSVNKTPMSHNMMFNSLCEVYSCLE